MNDKNRSQFSLEDFHRNISDKELLDDLVRVANESSQKRITFREYNSRGRFHSSTISTRFGSWNTALEKADLEKSSERNVTSETLFRNIVDVWTKLGRQPKSRDLTTNVSAYSSSTYADRFGGWRNALSQFVEWANNKQILLEPSDQQDLKSRKTPRNVNWRLRAQVLMRDSAKCRLCGVTPADGAKLHVDHIQAWSNGGETVIDNLQILCNVCNIGKSNI